jgi:hypothetical protein
MVTDQEWLARSEDWTCNHFSVARSDDTPSAFLHRVADLIEELGDIDVIDIVFSRYWTNHEGEQVRESRASVYYSRTKDTGKLRE